MELKDFIKTTVSDIAGAVTELNAELGCTGLQVNPLQDNHVGGTRYNCDGQQIQDIEFNLQITAIEKSEAGGGLKINVLKADMSKGSSDQTVSSIRFSLSVVLPSCPR